MLAHLLVALLTLQQCVAGPQKLDHDTILRSGNKKWYVAETANCAAEKAILDAGTAREIRPLVYGQWVSKSCEIQQGPRFLLRHYDFLEDGSFQIIQYFYEDDTCTTPKYAVQAKGSLSVTAKSWTVTGGYDATINVHAAHLIAYSKSAARSVTNLLRRSCLIDDEHFDWPDVQTFEKYLILYKKPEDDGLQQLLANSEETFTAELDCLEMFNVSAKQLSLLRMERTNVLSNNWRKLFFGEATWDALSGQVEDPTYFLHPLVEPYEVSGCKTCTKVKDAHLLKPPKLRSTVPHYTSAVIDYLDGDWISQSCESLAHGMFSLRQMSYDVSRLEWRLIQKYYDDPFCTVPSFTLKAEGTFSTGRRHSSLSETFQINYSVQGAKLTVQSKDLATSLRQSNNCGPKGHPWNRGLEVDISDHGGCRALGITLPALVHDIFKVDNCTSGQMCLFTGDFAYIHNSGDIVPSSFQAPFVKCDTPNVVVSIVTHDAPRHDVQNKKNWYASMLQSKSSCTMHYSWVPMLLVLYICAMIMQ